MQLEGGDAGRAKGAYAPPSNGRVILVALIAATGLAVVGAAFWREDLRYSLPTPKPPGLVQVKAGEALPVERWLSATGLWVGGKPVLLHFFNPACPCSRFNLEHVHALRQTFGDRAVFVAVVQAEVEDDELAELDDDLEDLDLDLPYVVDRKGTIAAEGGVYSTPQAVLVDERGRLVYRGNYNVSRYCVDPRTEFARLALESLVAKQSVLLPETDAYGCELPARVAERALAR
jgi:hypothetical protein